MATAHDVLNNADTYRAAYPEYGRSPLFHPRATPVVAVFDGGVCPDCLQVHCTPGCPSSWESPDGPKDSSEGDV